MFYRLPQTTSPFLGYLPYGGPIYSEPREVSMNGLQCKERDGRQMGNRASRGLRYGLPKEREKQYVCVTHLFAISLHAP